MSDDQYHYSYVLDGHEPVPADDMLSGVQWKVDHPDQGRVAVTFLGDGAIGVYTDFLGLNHNFERSGPPLLFETMIRDERTGDWWDDQWRYVTWEQAESGHRQAMEWARRCLAGDPVPEAPLHVGALFSRALGFLGHE